MAKDYLGESGLSMAMQLIKTALAGKQDKMEEMTEDEVNAMWEKVKAEGSEDAPEEEEEEPGDDNGGGTPN